MSDQKMREALEELISAHGAEGGPRIGHIYKAPTREWQRRVALAWQKAREALAAPAGEQVELTDAEISEFISRLPDEVEFVTPYFVFARAIIAAHEAKKKGRVP